MTNYAAFLPSTCTNKKPYSKEFGFMVIFDGAGAADILILLEVFKCNQMNQISEVRIVSFALLQVLMPLGIIFTYSLISITLTATNVSKCLNLKLQVA